MPTAPTAAPTPSRATIRRVLIGQFSADELRTLAFDLELSDALPDPATPSADAREIIAACERANSLPDLIAAIVAERPTAFTRKGRGAQPRNTNALKHGLYSAHFRELSEPELTAAMASGLQDEIAMLREIMARVLALANDADDLETVQNLLGSLGVASSRLAGMLKTQRILTPSENDDLSNALATALSTVVKELNLG